MLIPINAIATLRRETLDVTDPSYQEVAADSVIASNVPIRVISTDEAREGNTTERIFRILTYPSYDVKVADRFIVGMDEYRVQTIAARFGVVNCTADWRPAKPQDAGQFEYYFDANFDANFA